MSSHDTGGSAGDAETWATSQVLLPLPPLDEPPLPPLHEQLWLLELLPEEPPELPLPPPELLPPPPPLQPEQPEEPLLLCPPPPPVQPLQPPPDAGLPLL